MKKFLAISAALASAALAQAQIFLIDFGQTTTSSTNPTWNVYDGASKVALLDSSGVTSSFFMQASGFTASSATGGTPLTGMTGAAATAFGGAFPTVGQDYLYTNAGVTGTLSFTGLDLNKTYTFTLFGSRNTTGSRITTYTFTGATTGSNTLETVGNTSNVVTFSSVTATGMGNVTITVFNAGNFAYINAVKIEATATSVPEPSSFAALAGLGALGFGAARRRRR